MHNETNRYIQLLIERMDSIEATLRTVSTTRKNTTAGPIASRRTNKKQLQACLTVAHAIVEKRAGKAAANPRRPDREPASPPDDDASGDWVETDADSMFTETSPFTNASSSRRGTVQIAPDELPATGLGISGPSRSPRPALLEDLSDTTDDEFDDLSDDSDDDDDDSMMTDMTNMDDVSDPHERFETAQNSLSNTVSRSSDRNSDRNGSVNSSYSDTSCTGIDQRRVDPLMQAIKAKDANTVQRVLSVDNNDEPARRVSITIQRIPILHMAVWKEAGPDVIDALFKSSRVDINAVEPEEKKSALHWAVKYNRQSCCARLLQAPEVNVEIQDKYRYTPLQSALHLSAHSDADVYTVVKLLLEAGAKIPAPLPRGMSNTVETLVKKYEKRRRASGASTAASPDLSRAQTSTSDERRPSDGGDSPRRRFTFNLGRSVSARY